MSINHFHTGTDLEETPWWQQQQSIMETPPPPPQNSSGSSSSHKIQATNPQQQFSSWPNSPHQFHHHQLWLNSSISNNNDDYSNSHNPTLSSFNNTNEEHEPMFEKPLTPSDVGKLNRLVIPKQHAEKYFPLGGDSHSGSDKGLLLSFEDESGKCWRFRYSYWNSSQSYVLTKGWSRYVKEKRLDAGDVILFERHRSESERLFIRWRRRGSMTAQDEQSIGDSSGGWPRGLYSNQPYPVVTVPLYQHQHAGSMVQSQTTSVGNSRTLRLFGVNLECQLDDSEGSELGHQQFNYSVEAYDSTNRHNHMDITFSQEDEN